MAHETISGDKLTDGNDCPKFLVRFFSGARFRSGVEFTVRGEVSDAQLSGSGGGRGGRF